MRIRSVVVAGLAVLAVLATLAWWNRLALARHSLGIYTDIRHPRAPNRPVPWQQGPQAAAQAPGARPPNIVVILADDLGINDVSFPNAGWLAQLGVNTPAIDSISRDGVRFDAGYAGSSVCTVSRAQLLTGRYPWRFGLEFTPTPGRFARVVGEVMAQGPKWHPILVDEERAAQVGDFLALGLPPSEVSLARLLAARGYHTVHIGKWHLGGTRDMLPNAHGFQESLNMESGLYLPVDDPGVVNAKQDFDPIDGFLWPNMRYAVSYNDGRWFEPRGYLTDYFTEEAVEVIRRNRNRPFFLYLAHWAVHSPLQASRSDYDAVTATASHRSRVYGGMVRALDRSVARVLQALKDQGLENDTIVVFTSDNGAPGYIGLPDVNRPYRGWKLTFFEGGLRVPFAMKWPARIRPGAVHREPASALDILPTLSAAAQGSLPAGRVIDGVNLLPYIEQGTPQPPRALFWRDGPYQAVRSGAWKLISAQLPPRDWLFDLAADPHEQVDLAKQHPAKVSELKALLRKHAEGLPPPMWPSFIAAPIAIDKTLDQPHLPGDEYTYWHN